MHFTHVHTNIVDEATFENAFDGIQSAKQKCSFKESNTKWMRNAMDCSIVGYNMWLIGFYL